MYKVPNIQLDEERIEEIMNKQVDSLSKLPISESLHDSSDSMNKYLTAEIGFDILGQKQSIRNSTIEAEKGAGNGNSMNENVTDETVDEIKNATENNTHTNDVEKDKSANGNVMGTNDGKKDKSANENVMDTKNAQNNKSANDNNGDTNNAEKAKSANQRVTWRSTRSASTRESISNTPNVYIVSVKSTKFR